MIEPVLAKTCPLSISVLWIPRSNKPALSPERASSILEWQEDAERKFDHGGKDLGCKCPNPLCISNLEPVRPRFDKADDVVRCVYCESKAE